MLCVLVIIATGCFLFTVLVILPWKGTGSAAAPHLLSFYLWVALILTNYFRCATCDPGSPPPEWVPREESVLPRNECHKCLNFKPPRAHHCSVMRRCILRMDHYCVWVQNTVGFRNYKFFLLFLFYISIGFTQIWVTLIARVVAASQGSSPPYTPLQVVGTIVSCFCLLPCSIMLYGFFGFHFMLTWSNQTSIEYFNNERIARKCRKEKRPFRHLFDVGVVSNFRSVLGPSLWMWLLPVSGARGSGTDFPLCPNLEVHHPDLCAPPHDDVEAQAPSQSSPLPLLVYEGSVPPRRDPGSTATTRSSAAVVTAEGPHQHTAPSSFQPQPPQPPVGITAAPLHHLAAKEA